MSNQNLNGRIKSPKRYVAPSTPDLQGPQISSELDDLKLSKIKKKSTTNEHKMEIFDYSNPRISIKDSHALQTIEELGGPNDPSHSNLNITNIIPDDDKSLFDLPLKNPKKHRSKVSEDDFIESQKRKSDLRNFDLMEKSQGIDVAENSKRMVNHHSNDIFTTPCSFRIPEEQGIPMFIENQNSFAGLGFQLQPAQSENNITNLDDDEPEEILNSENVEDLNPQKTKRSNVGGERNWKQEEDGGYSEAIEIFEEDQEDMAKVTGPSENLGSLKKRAGENTTLDTYNNSRTEKDFEGSKRLESRENYKPPLDSLPEIVGNDQNIDNQNENRSGDSLNKHIADFSILLLFFYIIFKIYFLFICVEKRFRFC